MGFARSTSLHEDIVLLLMNAKYGSSVIAALFVVDLNLWIVFEGRHWIIMNPGTLTVIRIMATNEEHHYNRTITIIQHRMQGWPCYK